MNGGFMPNFSLIPKEEKFFDLIEVGTANMVATAKALKDLVDNWTDVYEKVQKIVDLEHAGDSVTHQIIAMLHRSFVTPFDREDIALLAHSMDDVVDFMHSAADYMLIYKVGSPGERVKELAAIILLATQEVAAAAPMLRNQRGLKKLLDHCIEINRLENLADQAYRSALVELFEEYDMVDIIKWREIYEAMETATDRCEDVANVFEGVALKNS
jgi:predicted phosphate transport protein (TIGR00153 family)